MWIHLPTFNWTNIEPVAKCRPRASTFGPCRALVNSHFYGDLFFCSLHFILPLELVDFCRPYNFFVRWPSLSRTVLCSYIREKSCPDFTFLTINAVRRTAQKLIKLVDLNRVRSVRWYSDMICWNASHNDHWCRWVVLSPLHRPYLNYLILYTWWIVTA